VVQFGLIDGDVIMRKRSQKQITWTSIGHQKPKEFLANAIAGDRLAQAYLFVGPRHVGKTALALDLAAYLVDQAGGGNTLKANPDFFFIDQEEEIKIQQIRELKQRFSLKSLTGTKKVAIIANAENLNKEAANAMLKILEEPLGDTVFIITTSMPGKLPATIKSRTQQLIFTSAQDDEFREFLKREEPYSVSKGKKIAQLSLNRIGIAKRLLHDEEYLQALQEWREVLEKIISGHAFGNMIIAASLAKRENQELSDIMNYWQLLLADKLSSTASKPGTRLVSFLISLEESITGLSYNLNKKLVLDNLLLNF